MKRSNYIIKPPLTLPFNEREKYCYEPPSQFPNINLPFPIINIEHRMFLAKLEKAVKSQSRPSLYNPVVELLCTYYKEPSIKQMVLLARKSYSDNTNRVMADPFAGARCTYSFDAYSETRNSTVPFVNLKAFQVSSQYGALHANLLTGLNEIYDILVKMTAYTRKIATENKPITLPFKLNCDFKNIDADKSLGYQKNDLVY
jgi:hypothetical protein